MTREEARAAQITQAGDSTDAGPRVNIPCRIEEGKDLATAFFEALNERGTAMVFTAVTMTIGVGTWAFSALKFQADMGILLAFMFFLNMLGALFLLPALAAFLLKPHVVDCVMDANNRMVSRVGTSEYSRAMPILSRSSCNAVFGS